MKLSRTRALFALSFFAPISAAEVFVVSPDNPDATAVQLAVDAAADGDLILLTTGNYVAPVIDGKSLTIIEDVGQNAVFNQGQTHIRNLAADQSVSLVGVLMTSFAHGATPMFHIEDNAGPVLIQDLTAFVPAHVIGAGRGTVVTNSASVVFLDSEFGALAPVALDGVGTVPGLEIHNSNVVVERSSIRGSFGLAGDFQQGLPGSTGAAGIRITSGDLFVGGSVITGGNGGLGAVFLGCTDAGDGGAAILSTGKFSQVAVIDSELVPGEGGGAQPGCANGSAGPPTAIASGNLVELDEAFRSLDVNSPVREGEDLTFTFTGEPGDLVLDFYSFDQGSFDIGLSIALHGALLPSLATLSPVFTAGVIGPTGILEQSLTLGPIGFDAATLNYQALHVTPELDFVLSNPQQGTVLDSSI